MYLDIGRDNDDDYHDGESSDENQYEQLDDKNKFNQVEINKQLFKEQYYEEQYAID